MTPHEILNSLPDRIPNVYHPAGFMLNLDRHHAEKGLSTLINAQNREATLAGIENWLAEQKQKQQAGEPVIWEDIKFEMGVWYANELLNQQ